MKIKSLLSIIGNVESRWQNSTFNEYISIYLDYPFFYNDSCIRLRYVEIDHGESINHGSETLGCIFRATEAKNPSKRSKRSETSKQSFRDFDKKNLKNPERKQKNFFAFKARVFGKI